MSVTGIRLNMMPLYDIRLLENYRDELMNGIDLTGSTLLARLRARKVITFQQEEVFGAAAGNTNRVGDLLDALQKGDEDTLDNFMYALNESGHAALFRNTLRAPEKADKFATPEEPELVSLLPTVVPCRSQGCPGLYKEPTTENKGQAMIVCIAEFDDRHWNLPGYEKDHSDLKGVFDCLDIEVTDCPLNLKAEEIKESVKGFASKIDTDIPFIILVLLSHGGTEEVIYQQDGAIKRAGDGDVIYRKDEPIKGNVNEVCEPGRVIYDSPNVTYRPEEVIYGADHKPVNVDTLRSFFSTKNCKPLRGKPKLTLVQACRGVRAPEVVQAAHYGGSSGVACTTNQPEPAFVANGGDEIVAYATQKDELSFVGGSGSFFIKAVVDVFRKYAANTHVADMLTKVNNEVSEKLGRTRTTGEEHLEGVMQMPQFVSSLRDKWFLKKQ